MNKNKWFLNGGRGSGRTVRLLCETYENKISDLEKENAELRNSGFTVSSMTEQQLKVALEKGEQLEKENAELKEKLKTAYRKGMRHMAKALKDYDRTDGIWTDYFEHTVDNVLQREQLDFEEYGTLAEQLTKAKEIIKKFSEFVNNEIEYDPEHPQEHTDLWNELCEEAEQFLSEVEK